MKVFFFGLGYCARRLIQREPWIEASGTARAAESVAALRREGVEAYRFDGAEAEPGLEQALAQAEAIVVSIPPRADRGDARALRLRHRRRAGAAAHRLLFDHRRLWRSCRRLDRRDKRDADPHRARAGAARGRGALDGGGTAQGREADILRLAGIYGPGRNALVNLRKGEARRIIKPGQVFNRAHVDDIAEISRLVLTRGLNGQIWNVADDEPAPPQDVIAYAAALLGLEPPPEEPFDEARLSPMAREFYADNKRVSIAKAKARARICARLSDLSRGAQGAGGGGRGQPDGGARAGAAGR